MVKRIIAKQENCIGCGLCEVYCTVQHSKSKDVVKAYNSERPKPISRVTVRTKQTRFFRNSMSTLRRRSMRNSLLIRSNEKDEKTGK